MAARYIYVKGKTDLWEKQIIPIPVNVDGTEITFCDFGRYKIYYIPVNVDVDGTEKEPFYFYTNRNRIAA